MKRSEAVKRIEVALVDDHPLVLLGLVSIFSKSRIYDIVGTGGSADEALAIAEQQFPDIVIMDLAMPGDVIAAIAKMTSLSAPVRVVVFTAYADVNIAIEVLDAGATGFVLKGRPVAELMEAVEKGLRDELFVSPDFSEKLMAEIQKRRSRQESLAWAQLTRRELQIVEYLLLGKTNREIASSLDLSEKTVKHNMTCLMRKLRAGSRLEVVRTVRGIGSPIGGAETRN